MSDNNYSLFKDHHDLQLFFKSDYVLFHNILEYFKDKGIFAFASTNDDMADFACNFFMGVDSQESLRKYIDVKAFPKISGFILKNIGGVSLEDLKDCLNSYQGSEFRAPKMPNYFMSVKSTKS